MQGGTRFALRSLCSCVLLVAVAGCPAAPVQPGAQGVALEVVNNSSDDVVCLYVSPQGNDTWGADLLGAANMIDPAGSFTVHVPPGNYDLMVEGIPQPPPQRLQCPTGRELGRRMGVSLTEDSQWVLYPE